MPTPVIVVQGCGRKAVLTRHIVVDKIECSPIVGEPTFGCPEHPAERKYVCGVIVNMLSCACVVCTDDIIVVIDMVSEDIRRLHALVGVHSYMLLRALDVCACGDNFGNVVGHVILGLNCSRHVEKEGVHTSSYNCSCRALLAVHFFYLYMGWNPHRVYTTNYTNCPADVGPAFIFFICTWSSVNNWKTAHHVDTTDASYVIAIATTALNANVPVIAKIWTPAVLDNKILYAILDTKPDDQDIMI